MADRSPTTISTGGGTHEVGDIEVVSQQLFPPSPGPLSREGFSRHRYIDLGPDLLVCLSVTKLMVFLDFNFCRWLRENCSREGKNFFPCFFLLLFPWWWASNRPFSSRGGTVLMDDRRRGDRFEANEFKIDACGEHGWNQGWATSATVFSLCNVYWHIRIDLLY